MRPRRPSTLAGLLTAGVLLVAPATAPAANWLLPAGTLSQAGEDAIDPAVALDSGGNATIVFLREDAGERHVHLQRVRADGTAEPLLTLTEPGDFARAPQVVVDPAGVATVTWGESGIIVARRVPPGSAPGPIVTMSGALSENSQIALAVDGTATIAWSWFDGANTRAQARRLSPTGDAGILHTLSAAGAGASIGDVAVDDTGTAHIVWQRQFVAQTAAVSPADVPGPVTTVSPIFESAFAPTVATVPGGTAIIAWTGGAAPPYAAKTARSVGGAPYGPAQTVSTPGEGAQGPDLAAAPSGAALLTWNAALGRVQGRRLAPGGTLGPILDLAPSGSGASSNRIAMAPSEAAMAVWIQPDGSHDIVHARSVAPNDALGPIVPLSEAGGDAGVPRVAVDPAGNATAVWERDDGSNPRVQSAAYDAAGPVVTALAIPATATVGQPAAFGVAAADRSGVSATSWSFGDGSLGAGPFVTHTFASPGARTVAVTLTDGAGNTSTASGSTSVAAASAPAPGPPSAPVLAKETAKLQIARAQVQRTARRLDVLAPITKRASGLVRIELQAAGRRTRFAQAVDATRGHVRVLRAIPAAQARLGTGIVTLRYPGDTDTRPQEVRLRAASQKANLTARRPTLVGNRLRTSGTVSSRARGVVRVQLEYAVGDRTETVQVLARIRNGRWRLDHRFAADRIAEIIQRRVGTVHSSILFTGYFPARIRGEMRSFQVLGAR